MVAKENPAFYQLMEGGKVRFFLTINDEFIHKGLPGTFTVDYHVDRINDNGYLQLIDCTNENMQTVILKPYYIIPLSTSIKISFEKFADTEFKNNEKNINDLNALVIKHWFNSKNTFFIEQYEFAKFRKTLIEYIGQWICVTSKMFKNLEVYVKHFECLLDS